MSTLRSIRTMLAMMIAIAVLAACAQNPTGTTDPAATLHRIKQTYDVAQSAAALYSRLPFCGTPNATKLCADPKVVIQIDEANTTATKAIAAADAAVKAGAPNVLVLIAAADAAATDLSNRTPKVKP